MEPISDSLVTVYYSVPWPGTGLVILLGPAGARASNRALSHSNGVKISPSEPLTCSRPCVACISGSHAINMATYIRIYIFAVKLPVAKGNHTSSAAVPDGSCESCC